MKKESFVLAVLAFSIVLSSLVIANHIITTSGGGTSYNYNSSSTNSYNISVNNTDTGANANITLVNITLPSSFSFSSNSNWTDASGTFSSSGNSLSWQNSAGLVMNSSRNYFVFDASSPINGSYNISIETTNATGIFRSNISVTINDTTPPVINYTTAPTNGANLSQNYLIFNITSTDPSETDTLTLRVYNGSQSLINSSSANSTTLPLYLNVSNLTQGTYYYNITVNDTRGNINNSETRSLLLDTTAPSVTFGSVSDTETTLNVTVDISDSGSGIGSSCSASSGWTVYGTGTTQYLYRSGLSCGTSYSYTANCSDRAGNFNSASDSDTTDSCSSSSSSSSGGGGEDGESTSFWTSTFVPTTYQIKMGFEKEMEKGERVKIKVGNESHYVGVIKVNSKEVTINVSSTPQQAVLKIGETKKFEVSNDSYYDVSVTLNGINNSAANLTVLSIYEKMPKIETSQLTGSVLSNETLNETNLESDGQKSNSILKNKWTWIILAAIILGLGATYTFLRWRRIKKEALGLILPSGG